jgi:hypothetical protein
MIIARLYEAVAAVAPIVGVSGVQGSIRIDFNGADQGQIDAANAVVAGFDYSQAADDLWITRTKQRVIGSITPVRLAVDRTNSTVNFADCTGLSFDLAANSHYAFEFVGAYIAAAGTTGLQIAVNGPASPNLVAVASQIATSATAAQNGVAANYDVGNNATASGGATALPFWVKGNISTGASGGTFTLRFRSEIAASAVTIKAGSYGLLYGVN